MSDARDATPRIDPPTTAQAPPQRPPSGEPTVVRRFDGDGDEIELRATPALEELDAVAIAAVVRPRVLDDRNLVALHDEDGDSAGYGLALGADGRLWLRNGQGLARASRPGLVRESEWALVAVTKPAGAAVPHFHAHAFAGEWAHVPGGGKLGSAPTVPDGTARLGSGDHGLSFDGDYRAAAIFDRTLSDGEIERLAGSLSGWLDLDPAGMWVLDQAHSGHPVLDETGNGADEVEGDGTEAVREPAPLEGIGDDTIFVGDLSTGGFEQWTELQLVGDGASATIAASDPPPPSGEGHYGRFELSEGDERAEAYRTMELREGDDVYVRFHMWLDAGFPAQDTWQLVWQLHQEGGGSPPVALYVDGSDPGRLALEHDAGYWWRGPDVEHDRWYEVVVRVNHSRYPEVGFVELWLDGQPQRLENGRSRMHGETMLDDHNYPKIGYYRDPGMSATGVLRVAGYTISTRPPSR